MGVGVGVVTALDPGLVHTGGGGEGRGGEVRVGEGSGREDAVSETLVWGPCSGAVGQHPCHGTLGVALRCWAAGRGCWTAWPGWSGAMFL